MVSEGQYSGILLFGAFSPKIWLFGAETPMMNILGDSPHWHIFEENGPESHNPDKWP